VTSRVAAILLAAGKSRRMGCCKQMLPLGERKVIDRCLDALVAGGADEVVVVVSEEGQDVAEAVRAYPARFVINTAVDGDMASSVRVGRDALTTAASGVIVLPGDYPLVSAGTISSLIEEHAASPDSIVIPCHDGRRGHPLLFPRTIMNGLTKSLTLRDLVRGNPDRISCVNVADPGVLYDMDTPEDYQRIRSMIQSNEESYEIMAEAVIENEEWESRCHGCGECCFEKIEDDQGTIFYLMSACRYLDLETRQCRIYENRFVINPDCVKLTADLVPTLRWLPQKCGYLSASQPDVPPMPQRLRSRRKKGR
jgi:molybdenum cofactor cytidylyltransferase